LGFYGRSYQRDLFRFIVNKLNYVEIPKMVELVHSLGDLGEGSKLEFAGILKFKEIEDFYMPEIPENIVDEALEKAKKIKKDLKLVILGEGGLESYLKELIKNLNLENDVYLLGWQKNPFKFLANSKLFVLFSLWEGFGIVILEAMACGIPVISSDCKSGPREILAPDTNVDDQTKNIEYGQYGILVPVCDGKFYAALSPLTKNEKILSDAIIEIFTNEKLTTDLIKKSQERATDFDIKKIIKNWNFL